jgi:hypothetical protein
MHEIYTHTVFEPSAKKIPSLLVMLHRERDPCFVKRDSPSCDKADKTVFPETYLVP